MDFGGAIGEAKRSNSKVRRERRQHSGSGAGALLKGTTFESMVEVSPSRELLRGVTLFFRFFFESFF